jgi:hemerythrin-like domain-containing protein
MSNKLQNVKAVQQMLEGNHKFQTKKTVGFSDAETTAKQNERHDVGDVWEETDSATGITYVIEQCDGFRIKKTKNSDTLQSVRDEIRSFPNCRKDVCICTGKHQVDIKMRKIHGMCLDCVIDMEHELKKSGEYEAYEQNKIRENALAWLESAERDVEMLKQAYTESSKFVSSTNGDVETWAAKMTPEEFNETVQKQFEKFKEEFLNNLNNKENNEAN